MQQQPIIASGRESRRGELMFTQGEPITLQTRRSSSALLRRMILSYKVARQVKREKERRTEQ